MSEARFARIYTHHEMARVIPSVETASVILAVFGNGLTPALDEAVKAALAAHEWAAPHSTERHQTRRITLDGPTDATPDARLAAVTAIEKAARKALESRGFVVIGRLM